MGLTTRGVKANLRAAAEGQSEGRGDHRARAVLDGHGHLLEAMNDRAQLFPFALLRCHEELHQVGADGEIFAVAGNEKPAKSRTASESGLSTAEANASTSPPMAFLSECSSIQPMPSPDRRARLRHWSGQFRWSGGSPRCGRGRGRWRRARASSFRAGNNRGRRERTRRCAGSEQGLDARAYRKPKRLHAVDGGGDASSIPHFKGPHLPVEAGAHGAVDGSRVAAISPMRSAA